MFETSSIHLILQNTIYFIVIDFLKKISMYSKYNTL